MNRLTSRLLGMAAAVALALAIAPGTATAQMMDDTRPPVEIDLRGGLYMPTFDIADAADPGFGFGAGIGIPVGQRLTVRGNADFGFHPGAEVSPGTDGPDVDVFHYVVGVGYLLTPPESPFYASVNLGAGALNFAVDAPGDPGFTYFAINAGGEVGYRLNESVSMFLSPQGDIAFSDEEEVGTGDSWVWPITAGIEIRP